jgi:lipopolysaccharide export system ATP-binding protein
VLITDHNYREVLDTCDHSYVLHDGVIITEGNKEQILNVATLDVLVENHSV